MELNVSRRFSAVERRYDVIFTLNVTDEEFAGLEMFGIMDRYVSMEHKSVSILDLIKSTHDSTTTALDAFDLEHRVKQAVISAYNDLQTSRCFVSLPDGVYDINVLSRSTTTP